ncbi:MAG: hypothetical protein D6753_16425 [Planctomycetota bacterium]|nr:MAG: hypothetical protein D6753_16425 [Planctomycetota bacterium]
MRIPLWLALGIIIVAQAVLLWNEASRLSPTYDEPAHLVAGLEAWRTGRCDLYDVNPPLFRLWSAIPAVVGGAEVPMLPDDPANVPGSRTEFKRGQAFLIQYRQQGMQWLIAARRMNMLWAVLGTLGVFGLGLELTGRPVVGLLASLVWAFNPNILGHGILLTGDVPAAAAGAWFSFAAVRACRLGTWASAARAGGWLGLAVLTKFTLAVLVPLLPVLAWLARRSSRPWLPPWPRLAMGCARMVVLLAAAWIVLAAGYRFQGIGRPLGDFQFISRALTGHEGQAMRPGNLFRGSRLSRVPVPLPASLVQGIDNQWQDFDHPQRSYWRGRWQVGGWWWFYLAALSVKLPLGLLAMLAVSAPAWALRRPFWAACLLPTLWLIAVVSAKTNMNEHVRYLWVVLPWLSVMAAAGWDFANRIVRGLLIAGTAWVVAAGLTCWPWGISYSNELVGGIHQTWRVLAGSNVDWDQGWIAARRWLEDHRAKSSPPIFAHRPSPGVLEAIGVAYTEPDSGLLDQDPPVRCRVLVSTQDRLENAAYQAWWPPVERIGCCIEVYEASSEELAAYAYHLVQLHPPLP